jgi:hypothetical protein
MNDPRQLRIASLVPSLTELVAALGLADRLVARTGYCIHPTDALRDVPKVGGTKDVNLPKLRRLAPTHLLVNVDENRRETVDAIRAWAGDGGPAVEIVTTHPCGPEDSLALIDQLACAFGASPGVGDRAEALRRQTRVALAATRPEDRLPTAVLYLIWRDPWMTIARDTYLSRMLARVNWLSLPAVDGGASGAGRYPVVHGNEPWLAEVREVLLSSEPYAFAREHEEEARRLCPNAGVRRVDGEMLGWYGARTGPGLDYLRALADTDADSATAADDNPPWTSTSR